MKNTLVLSLLALVPAAIASADTALTLNDAVLKVVDYNGTTSSYTGNFSTMTHAGSRDYYYTTLMLVLDWDTVSQATLTETATLWADFRHTSGTTTSASIGVGLRGWSNDATRISANSMWETGSNGRQATDGSLGSYVKDGKVVLTMVLHGSDEDGNSSGVTMYASDGSSITSKDDTGLRAAEKNYTYLYISDAAKSSIDSIYVFDSALTADQVKALSAAAIAAVPEPATATLSLLALAALAARRRRK